MTVVERSVAVTADSDATGARRWSVGGLDVWPALALFAVAAAAAATHVHLMRGTTFYVDEWSAIFQYGWSPRQLLEPVNGHNAFLGRIAWYSGMALFGISEYLPFRILGLMFNLWAAVALYAYVLRRIGALPAVGTATLILFLGSSFHTVLWPAAAVGVFAVGALVLTLLCLERRTVRGNVTACGLILLAFGSGGMGVMVYTAALAELVLRRRREQWWVVAVPPVFYGIWLSAFSGPGPQNGASLDTVVAAPRYVVKAMAYATAGLFGRSPSTAAWTLVAYGALLALLLWFNRRRVDLVRVSSLATAALTFWGLTAVFRGGLSEAGAPRYIAFGAIPLALVLLEAGRGWFGSLPGRAAIIAVTSFSVMGNLSMLTTAGSNFRYIGRIHRAQLGALEAVRPSIDRGYVIPGEWARYVTAASYFSAVDRFGSPALPLVRVVTEHDAARMAADDILRDGSQVGVATSPVATPCRGATLTEFVLPRRAVVTASNPLTTPVELRLRRFGDGFAASPDAVVAAGHSVRLTVTPDATGSPPWRATTTAPVAVCTSSLRTGQ